MVTVYSTYHANHIKYAALWENAECLNVTPSGAHSNRCYLNGK